MFGRQLEPRCEARWVCRIITATPAYLRGAYLRAQECDLVRDGSFSVRIRSWGLTEECVDGTAGLQIICRCSFQPRENARDGVGIVACNPLRVAPCIHLLCIHLLCIHWCAPRIVRGRTEATGHIMNPETRFRPRALATDTSKPCSPSARLRTQ